jgi:hypothetical protein
VNAQLAEANSRFAFAFLSFRVWHDLSWLAEIVLAGRLQTPFLLIDAGSLLRLERESKRGTIMSGHVQEDYPLVGGYGENRSKWFYVGAIVFVCWNILLFSLAVAAIAKVVRTSKSSRSLGSSLQ